MMLNRLILFALVTLIMVCFNTKSFAYDLPQKEIKPVCDLTEQCFGSSNSDILVIDPFGAKLKIKDLPTIQQDFVAMANWAYGAKVKSLNPVYLYKKNLHIINRQLLL
jgi:hypothetical protein